MGINGTTKSSKKKARKTVREREMVENFQGTGALAPEEETQVLRCLLRG